jgi:hypothetical protein
MNFFFRYSAVQKNGLSVLPEVNDHPRSGWLEFSALGRKGKSTSVLLTVHLQPGAEHPVCMARNLSALEVMVKWRSFYEKI